VDFDELPDLTGWMEVRGTVYSQKGPEMPFDRLLLMPNWVAMRIYEGDDPEHRDQPVVAILPREEVWTIRVRG
jgi:hypothetical protein